MRTYTIELRCDFENKETYKVIEQAAKVAAKHLYTQALLASDRRKPSIALYGSDFFTSEEEISLMDDVLAEDSDGS